MKKQVLVINYHRVDAGLLSGIPAIDQIFSVKKSSFEDQVMALVKNKVPVVSCADLVNGKITEMFSVAITVDDGNASDFEIVYPVLKENGMTATFFLLSGKQEFLKKHELRKLIEDGFSIGSHGITHRELNRLGPAELQHELEYSKKILEQETACSVDFFAFPFGSYNKKIIRMAEIAGYKAVFTTDAVLNPPESRPFVIHRWSVKKTTSLKQFERIVTDRNFLKRFIFFSKTRKFVRSVIGRRLSDRLNLLFCSINKSSQ